MITLCLHCGANPCACEPCPDVEDANEAARRYAAEQADRIERDLDRLGDSRSPRRRACA